MGKTERNKESVCISKRSTRVSLASHQIYNLHFYIIGLCLCCLLIVHPLLLKWQNCVGKFTHKTIWAKNSQNARCFSDCCSTSWHTIRDVMRQVMVQAVLNTDTCHLFSFISHLIVLHFNKGQDTKQRHSSYQLVSEKDIFTNPQK